MATAKYDFRVRKGDTFRQRQIRISIKGAPMDLTDAKVKMKIKYRPGGKEAADFNPEVIDAPGGIINLPYWRVDLDPLVYVYDLEITTSNDHTLTYMEGNFEVTPDL